MSDRTPPAVNLKCIVFTALLASGYWFLPNRNKYVLAALCYFPYLALAWYDYIYECKHNFGPTYLARFYSWAKPQSSRQIQIYKNWAADIRRKVDTVDLLVFLALLALVPVFIHWEPKVVTEEENRNSYKVAIGAFVATLIVLLFLRLKY
jgi:hypothetical protein